MRLRVTRFTTRPSSRSRRSRQTSENIEENFKDYLNGFSDNVQDILARMNFSDQVERLSDPDVPMLYQVVSDFCSPKADMSPDKIKAVDMGYIFENLIQRFSESYDEDAGAHFTSRDIVYLMTDLLIAADPNVFDGDHITKTVYDQTMGTSQMLGCTEERLRQLDVDARVTCFGQEFNPFTYGIAKASALIRGEDDENMQFGDTLSNDKFGRFKFDYCITNPPFGDPWNPQAAAVEKEHKQAGGGRFPVKKLPAKGDGQMLFTLNGLSKLKDDGVMAIVQDASPLYKGGCVNPRLIFWTSSRMLLPHPEVRRTACLRRGWRQSFARCATTSGRGCSSCCWRRWRGSCRPRETTRGTPARGAGAPTS